MPVRKIPRNHMCVTGTFATTKADRSAPFESLLERDYMLLLEFDPRVVSIEEQPVRIPVPGVANGYVPDVLVHYNPAPPDAAPHVELVEVKHTSDLAKNGDKYRPKFEAARRYAAQRNWQFVIVTEKEIRTQRLKNLAYLRGFRRNPVLVDHAAVFQSCMQTTTELTLGELLDLAHRSSGIAMPTLTSSAWTQIAHRRLKVDLDSPLSLGTKITLGGQA
jgi:hypothetical protein